MAKVKIVHINPNCKDSTKCLPHGETGEVEYKSKDLNDNKKHSN